MAVFEWTPRREQAALLLAQGYTVKEVATSIKGSERQIYRWKSDVQFAEEVDRLTLMAGIASRAERLRIVQRVARQKVKDDMVVTERDLLDWLKFAQSETDGVKLDLTQLSTAFGQDEAPLAGGGSIGIGTSPVSEADDPD